MFPPHAIPRFLECTGLSLLLIVWFSLFKMQQTYKKKKCFCCKICTHSLINPLSHLLFFVLGKTLICFFYVYTTLWFFLCVCTLWVGMSPLMMMVSEQNFLFCIWLFSTGLRWSWMMHEVHSLPHKSSSLIISSEKRHFIIHLFLGKLLKPFLSKEEMSLGVFEAK